jgi:hydrogenase maturation factor HypF (carbamoyltransferase family)
MLRFRAATPRLCPECRHDYEEHYADNRLYDHPESTCCSLCACATVATYRGQWIERTD